MVPLIVLSIILAFFTLDYVVERVAQVRLAVAASRAAAPAVAWASAHVDSALLELPPGVFVGPGHVWVRLAADGKLQVGVDRLLLSLLGCLDAIYTLTEGAEVKEQDPLVILRCNGRALKVRSPIEGRMMAVNPLVTAAPRQAIRDPFGQGWIYQVKPAAKTPTAHKLVSGEMAQTWMRCEAGRLRGLLSDLAGGGASGERMVADGDAPIELYAEHLEDHEWERLLANFFEKGGCPCCEN